MRWEPGWPSWSEAIRCFYAFGIVTAVCGLGVVCFGLVIMPFTDGITDPAMVFIFLGGVVVTWGAFWAAIGAAFYAFSRSFTVDVSRVEPEEDRKESGYNRSA